MTILCDAISAALDVLPASIRTPAAVAYTIGGLFVAAGVHKIVAPTVAADEIKATKFYTIASSPSCGGCCVAGRVLRLEKGNNLINFTRLIGVVMAVSGAAFASGYEQKYSSLAIATFLALFNIFVHLNLDAPLKTEAVDIAKFIFNALFAYGALSVGGWTACGQKGPLPMH